MLSIIGLGFVGLTTALGFADKGFKVFGYEIDLERRNQINNGVIPFHEPQLSKMLIKHKKNNNFQIISNFKDAINNSNIIFLCVGTPSKENGAVDLSFIEQAIENIFINLDYSNKSRIICIKSTVPPETTKYFQKKFSKKNHTKFNNKIGFVSNPEFLREGYAWEDFMNPDRIIIGSDSPNNFPLMKEIYGVFNSEIYFVNSTTAEFIKYSSNAFLSNMISFANEISIIGNLFDDINIKKTFEILHKDKRWNGNPAGMSSYFYPGCGYGGYCLPKDLEGLIDLSMSKGYDPQLIKNILRVNEQIISFHIEKILKNRDTNTRILILGLSFKPESDDVRNTPSAKIISVLNNIGFKNINAYDPISIDAFRKAYQYKVNYFYDLESAVNSSDLSIIATKWKEFKEKFDIISKKDFFDLRYYL